MAERIEKIAEDTYRVLKNIPGVEDIFTVHFIKGDGNILLEPGPGSLIPTILAAAGELGMTDFRYIIPSHVHMDHGGASGELAGIFKQATVIANSQGAKHLIDPHRLIRSTRMSFGDDFEKTYGAIEPVPESRIKVIRDSEKLNLDGHSLIFYETPGHAPHHIATFDTGTGGLFCGEALGLIYQPDTQPLSSGAPPNFDLEVYIETMEKLRELPAEFLVYSHGGLSREPEKSISTVIRNVREIGEVILQNLKEYPEEVAARNVSDYIQERFGVKLTEYTLMNNVTGFGGYYRKLGLL